MQTEPVVRPSLRWLRVGAFLGVIMLMLAALPLATPATHAVGVPDYAGADALLADSGWPTRGRTYTHRGIARVAGPAALDRSVAPATRGRAVITKNDPGANPSQEWGNHMRGAFLAEDGSIIIAAAFTGFIEIGWTGNQLKRLGQVVNNQVLRRAQLYVSGGGETWVEDVTVGRGNAVYLAHEGGAIRKAVKVGSGTPADPIRWSDLPTDCAAPVHPDETQCGWKKSHGFTHAPVSLYPYRLASDPAHWPDRIAVLFFSPDRYVAALDDETGEVLWRYFYCDSCGGNKEGAREKGLTWGADGTIYFGWGSTLYAISPTGQEIFRLPVGAPISAGPVLVEGPGDDYLYFAGSSQFIQVNLTTRAVARYSIGASPLDADAYPRNSKERWPATSPDGQTIYFSSANSLLYAMDRATWQPRWVHEVDAGAGDQTGVKSDPLVDSQGIIYVYASDQHVYAIDPRDGSRIWKFGTSGITDNFYPGTELALADDGTLYIATSGSWGDRVVWAVNRAGAPGPSLPATNTPTATNTPVATSTPTPTNTPVATNTPTPTSTPGPTGTPSATATAGAGALIPIVAVASQSATTAASAPASNLYDTGASPLWTRWSSNWLSGPGELSAVLDLGGGRTIGSFRWFVADGGLARNLSLAVADSPTGPWTTVVSGFDSGTTGNTWRAATPDTPATGSHVRIVITGGSGRLGGLGEFQVYAP
jgi:outer membrane protein assembly factor BamB